MNHDIYYEPLPYQDAFQESRKPKVYLSAGYGGGKTYSLCMKLFTLMSENHGLPGGILCPDLKMFKKDVLPTIREICEENSIEYTFNKTDHVFYFPHTETTVYVFHSVDDGASIRGPNLAFMLVNEVTLCSKGAYDAALARVRLKKANLLQVAVSGTPEGFNWAYDYFIENPREDTDLIFGDMRLNTHVAESYSKTLIESYDKLMQEQYVGGKFLNLKGNRAVYAFDRFKHLSPTIEREPYHPVWVSLDFNVDPMSATLWNRMGPNDPYLLQAFDEVNLPDSNTPAMVKALFEKLGSTDDVTIYPDPAGNARNTKGILSDIQILKQAGFTDIKYKPSIRSVRECLNATNNLFDKNRIRLHSSKCKNAIADLEQCSLKSGTHEIDKSNPKRSHWLDGMKDMIEYEFPITKRGGAREQRIR